MDSPTRESDGYVYVPDAEPGVFATAAPGMIVRKPNRSSPWIVVDHAINSVIIARWPGRLWRVVILDAEGVKQASSYAHYTRAIVVKVVDEVPASRLFGEHGEAVVAVLLLASQLDAATAERLAELRHPEADQAYSRAFRRWLDRVGPELVTSRSPINSGLTLVHRAVWDRAQAVAGPGAFVVDDDGERSLGPVWGMAASALLDASMALGAPSVVSEDAALLTRAWRMVASADDTRHRPGEEER